MKQKKAINGNLLELPVMTSRVTLAVLSLRPAGEICLPKLTQVKSREKFGMNQLKWPGKVEISTRQNNPGNGRSMQGYILKYPRFYRESLSPLWALNTGDLNLCDCSNAEEDGEDEVE